MMQEDPWDVQKERDEHAAKVAGEHARIAKENSPVKVFEEKRNASGIRKLELRDLGAIGRNYDHGLSVNEGSSVQAILAERQHTHGDFTLQSAFAQQLKDSLRHAAGYGRLSNGAREALEMICVKMSRIVCGNPCHKDSWDDIAGYATLVSKTLK